MRSATTTIGRALFALLWVVLCAGGAPLHAQAGAAVAEQYLFAAANAERAQRGLGALQWDAALYRAEAAHAQQMADRGTISHQFAGEPALAARAAAAGVRFNVVAENVAVAETSVKIHDLWMHSADHRANLLDPRVDSVAIAVVQRGGSLYAVEDFDRAVAVLSLAQQEDAVAALLRAQFHMVVLPTTAAGHSTCAADTGFFGTPKPWFVMRYTAATLDSLPDQLVTRMSSGKYQRAMVAACRTTSSEGFSAYRIAVLLYP